MLSCAADFLPSSASKFKKRDTNALNITFKPANKDAVIPAYRGARMYAL